MKNNAAGKELIKWCGSRILVIVAAPSPTFNSSSSSVISTIDLGLMSHHFQGPPTVSVLSSSSCNQASDHLPVCFEPEKLSLKQIPGSIPSAFREDVEIRLEGVEAYKASIPQLAAEIMQI